MNEYAEKKRAEREARLRVQAKRRRYQFTNRVLAGLVVLGTVCAGAFGLVTVLDGMQDRASRGPVFARAIPPCTPGPSVAALATEAAGVALSASRSPALTYVDDGGTVAITGDTAVVTP